MKRSTAAGDAASNPGNDSAEEQQFDAQLRATFYRFDCPPPDRLNAYFWHDALQPDEQAAIEQHLQGCPLCTAELEELAAFVESTAPDVPVPSPVAEWLRTLRAQVDQLAQQTQLVVATLLTPSSPQLAGVALRSTPGAGRAPSAPQSRLYSADDVDISLVWQPVEPGLRQLSIQVFEQSPGVYRHVLLAAAQSSVPPAILQPHEVTRTANAQLAPGGYNLVLASDDRFVVIPDLQLD